MGWTNDQAHIRAADHGAMAASNLLVNSFHAISQEIGSTARSLSNSTSFVTDMWNCSMGGPAAAQAQQVAAPFATQPDIPFGMQVAVTTAEATSAAGSLLVASQTIEGTSLTKLMYGSSKAKTLTVGFMARSSINQTFYLALRSLNSSGAVVRSYLKKFTLAANQDTLCAVQIPGDVAQALQTGAVAGLYVTLTLACGSNLQGPADAWTSGNFIAAADITNFSATVGNTFVFSGLVLFASRTPITADMLGSFQRPYDDELRRCQRYYATILANARNYASVVGQNFDAHVVFPVTMRVAPTASLVTAGGRANIAGSSPPVVVPTGSQSARFNIVANATGDYYALAETWALNARI